MRYVSRTGLGSVAFLVGASLVAAGLLGASDLPQPHRFQAYLLGQDWWIRG